ncbi:MAG: DUF4136 domain-containing protein [Chitinophagales bacterium]|nr:DUF4136 domain-containing protein [Bacteroidota bacterium]MBP7399843.1 DUF4136 domain-containing protein [Chitinophagales bacterium]MBK8488293.1 DUF4136 domain-containing protein [Bacteroidota bacterium]MBP8754694.1 DUF4136 domain-containing protein [Chitinophagales bacterium]MBP9188792.1 DUF4136 domain-containing protein [Chitinophagales bacterium]
MNILKVSLVVLFVSTLFSCSTVYVDSMKPKGVDYSGIKSFAWVNPVDADGAHRYDDKIYAPVILKTATNALLTKGMVLDTLNPQVVFVFDTQITQVKEYVQDGPDVYAGVGFGGPYYYGGFSAPIYQSDVREVTSNEGMLVIEMWDPINSKLLWRGWASQTVSMSTDMDTDVERASKFIIDKLPISVKK